MALESLGNRIDIKSLSLETPQLDREFDIEKEITAEDWQIVLKELDRLAEQSNWAYMVRLGALMKVAYPERAADLAKYDTQSFRELVYQEVSKLEESDSLIFFLEDLKLMFPDLEIARPDSRDWQECKNLYLSQKVGKERSTLKLLTLLFRMKLLFPDKFESEMSQELDSAHWKQVSEYLDWLKQSKDKGLFPAVASTAFVLFERKPEVTAEDWQAIMNSLSAIKPDLAKKPRKSEVFMKHVWQARLLTATKAGVRNGRLEVSYPKGYLEQGVSPSLPETRNF